MLCLGPNKSWGLMLLQGKLFYCLRLPIHPKLGGGDQNAMLGVNAASQQICSLSPAPHPSNARGKVTKMLCWGLMLLRSKLFYCLRLPIYPMLEGGDPNAMLGVIIVLEGYCCFAANSFYCLRLPIHPILEGGDPNAMLVVMKVSEANAASQQTLFIVSGSPSIHC